MRVHTGVYPLLIMRVHKGKQCKSSCFKIRSCYFFLILLSFTSNRIKTNCFTSTWGIVNNEAISNWRMQFIRTTHTSAENIRYTSLRSAISFYCNLVISRWFCSPSALFVCWVMTLSISVLSSLCFRDTMCHAHCNAIKIFVDYLLICTH